jgi:hypothetical protein
MASGDIAQLVIHTAYGFGNAANAFRFVSLTDDPTWRGRLSDAWLEFVLPYWVACLASDAHVVEVEVDDIYPGTDEGPDIFSIPSNVGAFSAVSCPLQVCTLLTWYSGDDSRPTHGRTYLPAVPIDQVVGGRFCSTDVFNAINTFGGVMLDLWGPGGSEATAQFGILRRQLDNAPVFPPVIVPITDWGANRLLATQRRRLE